MIEGQDPHQEILKALEPIVVKDVLPPNDQETSERSSVLWKMCSDKVIHVVSTVAISYTVRGILKQQREILRILEWCDV